MQDDVTIRSAHVNEIPAVLELWRAEAVASASDSEKAVRELCAFEPSALLVAEQDGLLIGTVIAAWDGWRGNLYRLAVRSGHRRLGIGSALVDAGERHLREQGATRMSSLVFDANDAIGLAQATGAAQDHRVLRFVINHRARGGCELDGFERPVGLRGELDRDRVPTPHLAALQHYAHDARLADEHAVGRAVEDRVHQPGLDAVELGAGVA